MTSSRCRAPDSLYVGPARAVRLRIRTTRSEQKSTRHVA